jgi:LCP family protein required for cell wall assembly
VRRRRREGGAHRRPGPYRRWPRRLLLGVNGVVLVSMVTVGSADGYAYYRLHSIKTAADAALAPEIRKAPPTTADPKGQPAAPTTSAPSDRADGLNPENILLIGNETRAGLTNPTEIAQFGSPSLYSGSLSDVIMVLHLDPAKDKASLLSIPRDLFLPMPAGSPVGPYQKIDAALNDGKQGPEELTQTIEDDLGIPINHFVELNFDGFENTVNAIGGINMDFPEPLFDLNSGLNVWKTGCVHLNGSQALSLVRARHLQYDPPGGPPAADKAAWPYDPESDLSRIVRDHTFLRVLTSTVESQGLANPLRANAFIGAVIDQLTIDPGLEHELVPLLTHYRHLNAATVPETTIPVTTVGNYSYRGAPMGDVDFPVQPEDNQVIAAWDGQALPSPQQPASVNVVSLTGSYQRAADTATALRAEGYQVSGVSYGQAAASTAETLIAYNPGDPYGLAQAVGLEGRMAGAVMLQPTASETAGTVTVSVGSLLVLPGAPAGLSVATTTTSTTTTMAPLMGASTTVSLSGTPSVPGGGSSTTTAVTVPTPGGQAPSSSSDHLAPWDPIACPSGS